MSNGFPGQPYLDQLRPERGWSVRVALLTTYSADLIAIGATLLAMTGRNSEAGSGNAADFAESVERMRDRLRVIVQRGRLQRPATLPSIAGVLDQFVMQQDYDESQQSWHPKLALVGYEGPSGERSWRLWIGSRNLTRSRDLDLGLVIDGESRRRKGARPLADIAEIGRQLAELAQLPKFPADAVAGELSGIVWRAPDDVRIESLELRQAGSTPATPRPDEPVEQFVVLSPFLDNTYVKKMADWGNAETKRTLVTTLPAVRGLSTSAKRALQPFRLLSLAPPLIETDESPSVSDEDATFGPAIAHNDATANDGEMEIPPVSLHAKLFAFWQKNRLHIVTGSANATDRAWSGRNAEAIVRFSGGPGITKGIDALVGSSMLIPRELLDEETAAVEEDPAELLNECRRHLAAHWVPTIQRSCERFVLCADAPPPLGKRGIHLEAGLATSSLHDWPDQAHALALGDIPLGLQTDLLQMRLSLAGESCGWLQRVSVAPPIAAERDCAAIARFLGPRGFYAWMRAMLVGDVDPPDIGPWEEHGGEAPGSVHSQLGLDTLTLEDILTAWARDPASFHRTDARFKAYVAAILQHHHSLGDTDRRALETLQMVWHAARDALMEGTRR